MRLPGTRSQRIALAVSVLLHLSALALYRPISALDIFPARDEVPPPADTRPLVFELVETPDDAVRERPDRTDLLSDKDALARDESAESDLEDGAPYSEGQVEHRVFAGGPQTPDSRKAEEGGDAGRREEDAFIGPEREEATAESLEDDVADAPGDDSPSGRAAGEAPDDAPDTRADSESRSSRERYTDALDLDQRSSRAPERGGVTLNTYAWDYANYLYDMKARLRSNTYPPAGFSLLGILTGEQVIRFRVLPDGTATEITVIEFRGDRSLLDTSLDAIRLSSPFRPLPGDFPEEYLELTWTFVYFVHRR